MHKSIVKKFESDAVDPTNLATMYRSFREVLHKKNFPSSSIPSVVYPICTYAGHVLAPPHEHRAMSRPSSQAPLAKIHFRSPCSHIIRMRLITIFRDKLSALRLVLLRHQKFLHVTIIFV